MCKLQSHFGYKMKKVGIALALLVTTYAIAQQKQEKCTLPQGIFVMTDEPKEEWVMEVKDGQVIETIRNGEVIIYSTIVQSNPNNCTYFMTVTQVVGNESDVKVGDKYITTVKDIIDNYLYIRTETQKTGMELILLKQK
ncbi:hypothetical protein HMPREF9700_01613 [Bergeyella zoohelcum CCUG 30536]|uniref:Lipocalin-like domain-containing protein n=2 Tax=Bergeyella zoohelcum TaxID=1015 RepID=A0A380ZT42_9FLAO|nr:hypothetical protein HMPREF9700_01613 [Bergeyella zoohelcum CCUG 30536]SUV52503.1 Uncharacterised protein [Bergeyella zoohelcum]